MDIFVKRYSKLVYHAVHQILNLHSYAHTTDDIEDIHTASSCHLSRMISKAQQFEGRKGCSLSS
jgi:hypothetical protein